MTTGARDDREQLLEGSSAMGVATTGAGGPGDAAGEGGPGIDADAVVPPERFEAESDEDIEEARRRAADGGDSAGPTGAASPI